MKITQKQSTAFHEAGHAVAAFFLGFSVGRRGVTIIPDKIKDNLGAAHVLLQLRERPDVAISPGTHVRIENHAVVCLAGDAAQRKLHPRSHYRAQSDQDQALELLDYISGSNEILCARFKVARLQAQALVNLRWKEITAVATALLERKTLTRDEVRQAIISTLPLYGAPESKLTS